MTRFLFIAILSAYAGIANAAIDVFTCEPEWAALAGELGGDLVKPYSATTALQDPHYIQARPSLIAKLRRAELIVCSGAQLEIGWLPALLQKANNRDVLPGTRGFMEASSLVPRLNTAVVIDRAMGDIHPQGNPHVQTDPRNIAIVARALAQRLMVIDPENTISYEENLAQFLIKWEAAIEVWQADAADLRGKRAITHHNSWVYLLRWLAIENVANLEEIPGLPPTASHLSMLTSEFSDGGADVIIRAPYQHAKPSEWLSDKTGIPAIILPQTVGATEGATDLFSMFDDIIARLHEAISYE